MLIKKMVYCFFDTGKKDKLNKIDYVKIIEENGGSVKKGEHAHHIAYKIAQPGKMREYAQDAKKILREYGIDPVLDPHNLVSAPNKGHSTDNIKEVYEALEQAKRIGLSEANDLGLKGEEMKECVKEYLYEALKRMGDIASNR